MIYVIIVGISCLVSLLMTEGIKRVALRFNVIDAPIGGRKIHTRPIPLLGGLALFISFFIILIGVAFFLPPQASRLTDFHVFPQHLIGILIGGFFLVLGGALDDIYNLKPRYQVIWPFLAALSIISSGIGIPAISNPFGGVIDLTLWKIPLITVNGVIHSFTVWSDALTFGWLLVAIYTTKFLDGLDGLVGGVTAIGSGIILMVSLFLFVNYPTALLSAILLGALLGFLFHNSHPAAIFLGEAGSTFCGYMLGVLAIVSGAKFATALLILGFPILDAGWVITRRIFIDKKSPFVGDRKHLHFRLLDAGLSHRQSVWILYTISLSFGLLALFLQKTEKLYALGLLALLMAGVGYAVITVSKKAS